MVFRTRCFLVFRTRGFRVFRTRCFLVFRARCFLVFRTRGFRVFRPRCFLVFRTRGFRVFRTRGFMETLPEKPGGRAGSETSTRVVFSSPARGRLTPLSKTPDTATEYSVPALEDGQTDGRR